MKNYCNNEPKGSICFRKQNDDNWLDYEGGQDTLELSAKRMELKSRIVASDAGVGWDDLRFPFTGNRVDVSQGRLSYNYFNCGVGFDSDARFPDEPVSSFVQMPHAWLAGSTIGPHFHWIQQSADMPNFMLAWRKVKNDDIVGVQTDFSNYTLVPWELNAFDFAVGKMQITTFPDIDMSDMGISDSLQAVFFRDSANTSGEFSGADPSSLSEIVCEFDIHYQIDGFGSNKEFIKD